MSKRLPWLLLGLLLGSPPVWADNPSPRLFPSRLPLQPLLDQLKQEGGDIGEVFAPRTANDLLMLQSGARYKFVVRQDGALYLSPFPEDAPQNGYGHTVLALGESVLTAGLLEVDHNETVQGITVNQQSHAYCPTFESLESVMTALARLGADLQVHAENSPPECIEVGADPRH